MRRSIGVWLGVAAALVACNRDEAPERTPSADTRAPAAPDARPGLADAASLPVDAASPPDARAVDAGVPRDAGPPRPKPAAPDAGVAAGACHRTRFETKLIAGACAVGGQAAAKAAMKKFTRAAKKQERTLECKSCHEKLSPSYPLKDDGLEHFKRLGGK